MTLRRPLFPTVAAAASSAALQDLIAASPPILDYKFMFLRGNSMSQLTLHFSGLSTRVAAVCTTAPTGDFYGGYIPCQSRHV